MPANLPPHYYELEREFKAESDPREKLRLAKELLALMPKHKGTDKLQAEMKAKISALNKQIQSGGTKHGKRSVDPYSHFDKEGAAQILLIGPPNSGKSTIFDYLTNAQPVIADYPYSTTKPMPGMMVYDTVPYQLLDTPPISEDLFDSFMPSLIREGDIIIVVVDVSTEGFENRFQVLLDRLEEKRIILTSNPPEEVEDPRFAYKKTIIAGHKYLDDGEPGLAKLKQLYSDYQIIPTSILDDDSMIAFQQTIFESLNIIRVYTKKVGHDPDFHDPIILPVGSTVQDAAYALHKDFAAKLQFAKIWGEGKHEGQRVKNSFQLTDKDIIEFHI